MTSVILKNYQKQEGFLAGHLKNMPHSELLAWRQFALRSRKGLWPKVRFCAQAATKQFNEINDVTGLENPRKRNLNQNPLTEDRPQGFGDISLPSNLCL
jgi:hypothetical protein